MVEGGMDYHTGSGMRSDWGRREGQGIADYGADVDAIGPRCIIQPCYMWLAGVEQECPAKRELGWRQGTKMVVGCQQLAHTGRSCEVEVR
jgi:hypothetical protein